MYSGRHSDFFMMIIFVLGTICFIGLLPFGVPESQADVFSYQHSPDDPWTPPFQ